MLPSSVSAPTLLVQGPIAATLFWIAVAACVVAQFFIIRAVVRAVPSETGSPHVPTPRRALEIAWAILPAVLIIAVFLGAWRIVSPSAPFEPLPTSSRGALDAPLART